MDSVTQAVLGAVVADVTLGRSLGRKAAWWGLALGTLPDLDIVAAPFMDQAAFLGWHRGISHGVLIMLLAPPLLTWLMRTVHGPEALPWVRGVIATFLVWLTHVLIDCLTVYGTGLWEPFSGAWVQWNLLFIIDPLFTLPLLIATLGALIFPWSRRWRPMLSAVGLALSCAYLAWAGTAKLWIDHRFADQIAQSGLSVEHWMSAPTPLNTVLWRCLAAGESDGVPGYWIGYASLLDAEPTVAWRWLPQRAELATPVRDGDGVVRIRRFSRGYWLARERDGRLVMADLRFGETTMAAAELEAVPQPWIFCWAIAVDGERIEKLPTDVPDGMLPIDRLWTRIGGERFAWER